MNNFVCKLGESFSNDLTSGDNVKVINYITESSNLGDFDKMAIIRQFINNWIDVECTIGKC